MQTVSKAFCDVSNRKGLVIGVVPCTESDPTCRPQPGYPNESVEIRIFTHLFLTGNRGTEPMSRNHINILSSDVIIALPGGPGTAGEVQLALRYGRPVVVYASNRDETPALPQRLPVEDKATPAVSVGERLRQAYELSQTAKSEVHYTTVIGWCRQVLDTATRDETKQYAHRLMSWSYNRRGEHLASIVHVREAFADFNAAIRHDKTRWRAFHNRGIIHGLEGRHKEARGDFTRAVELNPAYAEGYFKRAEINFMAGDYDNAIRDFQSKHPIPTMRKGTTEVR